MYTDVTGLFTSDVYSKKENAYMIQTNVYSYKLNVYMMKTDVYNQKTTCMQH